MTDPVSRPDDRTDTPTTGPSERNAPDMTQPPSQTQALPTETATPAAPPTAAPQTAAPPPAAPPPAAPPTARNRRTPDVLTLVVGLMSLAAATMVLAGWIPQLRMFDLRWVLSGGAVVLGVLLLAASTRSPRNRG